MSALKVEGLSYFYTIGSRKVPVLKNLSFEIKKGDFVAIEGPSGSGKSTLFYVLGCMLRPKEGKVFLGGVDVNKLSNFNLSLIRNEKIGFVFQHFHLLPKATVLENILLPTEYPCEVKETTDVAREKALGLAKRLGISEVLGNFPNQLSGGQQQRVAIARALMNDVDLILADEPTGNLDSKNSAEIIKLLHELNDSGKTIVLITHNPEISQQCKSIYFLRDGVLELKHQGKISEPKEKINTEFKTSSSPSSWSDFFQVVRKVAPLSLQNLQRNRTRSFLTMLGVTIGVASLLSMVTFGQYTKKKVLESYESLGANKISLWGYPNWSLRASDRPPVQFQQFQIETDVRPLTAIFEQIKLVSPTLMAWSPSLSFGGRVFSDEASIIGTTSEYFIVNNRTLLDGMAFTPYHVDNFSPVCDIGSDIAKKLFLNVNPVGKILTISGNGDPYSCRVLGVLEERKGNETWSNPNKVVVMPYTFYRNVNERWYNRLSHISMQAASGTDMERLSKSIKSFFERKYGKSASFDVDPNIVLIAHMKKFILLFTLMLSSVACLSLVVGGIGINNMMLVSINERLKEIGLLKAIGATDSSLRIQLMLESVVLCGVAGIVGIFMGFFAYELIIFIASKFVSNLSFEWTIEPIALLSSFAAILIVGIASGMTPSRRAQKLEVIEALRSE